MPTEQEKRIAELERQVKELNQFIESLQRPNGITPEFYQVLLRGIIQSSALTAGAETVTVNEAGTNSHTVANEMDGFIKIGGYNIPYYT